MTEPTSGEPQQPGYVPPPPPPPGYVPPPPPPPGYAAPPAAPGYAYPAATPGYAYPPGYDPTLRSRTAAGLLGIFLGGFGIHRFYLGYTSIGVWQIIVTVVTCGLGSIWGLIEGIMILTQTSITTDAEGRPLRE